MRITKDTNITHQDFDKEMERRELSNLRASIAGKGQEIDLLAIFDRAMSPQIGKFRSSHYSNTQFQIQTNGNKGEKKIRLRPKQNRNIWD